MATFTIKCGDTDPALRYALHPETVDLSGASVVFNMVGQIVRAPARIVTASPPVVEYAWQAGDTDEAGRKSAEFEVTYADGAVGTFPNADHLVINIVPDLG